MTDGSLLILSAADVREALPMADAVEAMKLAFAQLSTGEAHLPLRTVIPTPCNDGTALLMPAFLSEGRQMGVKLLSLFPDNPERGLPLIHALMTLFDGETGRPLAVMEAGSLTALRTGAASGAATDLLARTDARSVAIFGAGAQGSTQLEAVCAVRPIQQAWVHDPVAARADAFAQNMQDRLGLEVGVAATPKQALADADIVCTATTSPTPVFEDGDLKPGVHINAVGAYTPTTREVPEETVVRAKVVVDQREASMEEAGDLLMPMGKRMIGPDHIHAELGEIAAGRKPPRQSPDEVTLFKSVGLAVQDVAAAWRILGAAERMGLGRRVPL